MSSSNQNAVRKCRQVRDWSQQDLALRAGISRAAVSAIEQERLAPSVTAALAIARALGCTVEELFGDSRALLGKIEWAWPAPTRNCRYWQAEVGGCRWLYPVESTDLGELPHDGVFNGGIQCERDATASDEVLVIATCDPAVGLLAAEYARQTPFRILPFTRSSGDALNLMKHGKVHAAGVHLASNHHASGNTSAVRDLCGPGIRLLRIGVWEEGIAHSTHLKLNSARAAIGTRLKWMGREAGSGARQCLDELLAGRNPPRRMAPDHRSVALAIRCGWAEAGVCLRLVGEEAGLGFINLRREAYDLCFPAGWEQDRRIRALVDVVQSASYRRLLDSLPGYDAKTTGELHSC